jgi:hypothetical protein
MSAFARLTDPLASWLAADSIKDCSRSQRVVLSILVERGGAMDDGEIWTRITEAVALGIEGCRMSAARARSARSELVKAGLVEMARDGTGAPIFGLTPLGGKCHKWRLAAKTKQLPMPL